MGLRDSESTINGSEEDIDREQKNPQIIYFKIPFFCPVCGQYVNDYKFKDHLMKLGNNYINTTY